MNNQEMCDKVVEAMRAIEWNTIGAVASRIGESKATVRTVLRKLERGGVVEQRVKEPVTEYRIKK